MTGEKVSLILAHGGKSYDLTELVQSITWAGSISQVARTLDFSLLSARNDPRQPKAPVSIGDNVQLLVDGELRFDGFIFFDGGDSGADMVDVGCWDRGIYLKNNDGAYKFAGQTPEAITERLCRDFGIAVGNLAQTGITIRRNFPGVSLFKIIWTAYTLAARRTGERYQLRFRGDKLDVIAKKERPATLVLAPGSNLLSATASESAENLVSQVGIYDDSGRLLRVRRNEEAAALCGVMQRYLRTAKDKDADAQAAEILEDNGIQRKTTVAALGDPGLIAGESVIVREPVTGLWGRYWIDADTHTWKGGLYRTKLTLNLRNLMDEVEAGRELK